MPEPFPNSPHLTRAGLFVYGALVLLLMLGTVYAVLSLPHPERGEFAWTYFGVLIVVFTLVAAALSRLGYPLLRRNGEHGG